jgi:hypothetical protein
MQAYLIFDLFFEMTDSSSGLHLMTEFELLRWATIKKKGDLSICLINYAPRHEYVCGSGGIAPKFLTLVHDGDE